MSQDTLISDTECYPEMSFEEAFPVSLLRQWLAYDSHTGSMLWRPRSGSATFNGRFAGKQVGKVLPNGYHQTCLSLPGSSKRYYVYIHRLAAVLMLNRHLQVGEEIDHVDADKLNQRWLNLRVCSRCSNQRNVSVHRDNKSGFKGVFWNKKCAKWQSVITFGGKGRHLGLFFCVKDAASAYDLAALTFFGEFARTNKSMGLL